MEIKKVIIIHAEVAKCGKPLNYALLNKVFVSKKTHFWLLLTQSLSVASVGAFSDSTGMSVNVSCVEQRTRE